MDGTVYGNKLPKDTKVKKSLGTAVIEDGMK
jgi:hypothetical protein